MVSYDLKSGIIPRRTRQAKPMEGRGLHVERISMGKFDWLNLQNPDRQYMEDLAAEYGFNALNVEDCLTKFELPKLDSYDDHFFVMLHFPPVSNRPDFSKNSQISIFLGRKFLAMVHNGDLGSLLDLVDKYKGAQASGQKAKMTPDMLLHEMIDVLVDDLLHTSRKIIANLDELEDGVFDESRSMARNISYLRREINRLRRIANPLKRFVLEMARDVERLHGGGNLKLYFDDVIDHIDKVIETLDESRETMEIYKDTDFVLSTEKTNKVLAMLTIIFTLAIPATVIGTFYGMNVSLPGGGMESGILGPHTTFILVIAASVVPAAVMFAYFRRLGWLRS